jgi:KipI family sensor histidine kinase inhibitor
VTTPHGTTPHGTTPHGTTPHGELDDDVAHVTSSGDDALVLTLARAPSERAIDRVLGAWRALLQAAPRWLVRAQPSYVSLHVVVDAAALDDGVDSLVDVERALLTLPRSGGLAAGVTRVVPVHYGGEHGPDLHDVAAATGLAVDDVVARHVDHAYRCAFTGFVPGFAYLLGLDPALGVPRRTTPRARVPAGSVGLGGAQTGVYPSTGPGGWQLIGRTTTTLAPGWVAPGDVVVFTRAP